MPEAKLRLTIPEEIWISELTRQFPQTRVRVLAAIPDGLSGVGLAEIRGSDVEAFLDEMRVSSELAELETLRLGAEEVLVQFETTNPLLLLPARRSGTPLEMPFDIQDGQTTWELAAPTEQLARLAEQLDAFEVSYDVAYVREAGERDQLLTERQRELVLAAMEAGYYDTPRGCSLSEVAERVGIAKSTCSSVLHRAEGAILKSYAQEQLQPSLDAL